MPNFQRRIAAILLAICGMFPATWPGVIASAGEEAESTPRAATPAYRVEADGFDAAEADIRAVLDSAARELWQFFPGHEIEPIVVQRGRGSPIVLFDRNDRGEIVMRLDTGSTYWAQYSYQFAHEFCHVLCGYRGDGNRRNKWFEETLCETASLFVLRGMSRSWKDAPPYPHWRDFRDALRSYADDVIRRRDKLGEIHRDGMPAFYRTHQETLERDPNERELNGAMAVVLLHVFERQPDHWEAVRWLNESAAPDGETFEEYLRRWHEAVPERRKALVRELAELYGVAIGKDD